MGNSKDASAGPSTKPSNNSTHSLENTDSPSTSAPGAPHAHDKDRKPAYSGGSWRGKATAVAEVARENAAMAIPPLRPKASTASFRKSSSPLSPTKAVPSAASTTKLNVSSNANEAAASEQESQATIQEESEKPVNHSESKQGETQQTEDRPLPAAGWRGWWSRPNDSVDTDSQKSAVKAASIDEQQQVADSAKNQDTVPAVDSEDTKKATEDSSVQSVKAGNEQAAGSRSSWFGLWKSGTDAEELVPEGQAQKSPTLEPSLSTDEAESATSPIATPAQDSTIAPAVGHARTASGSWAFWSRERPSTADQSRKPNENGQLAVASTESQGNPEPVTVGTTPERPTSLQLPKKRKAIEQGSASRPQSISEGRPKTATSTSSMPVRAASTSEDANALQALERTMEKTSKVHPKNLILPPFRETYQLAHTPSYWQQLIRMFGRGSPEDNRHLSLSPSPFKVRKAVVIGVHGYFPSPIVQKVIGPPTGTSFRFASEAAAALEQWGKAHDQSIEIEKVALEGEGIIAYRLDTLWKLLLNWVDHLRSADLVFFACHSQGCPVGIMLAAKLIQFGCLSPHARMAICAMAGVNLGPFASYKSRFLDSSASELFDFSVPASKVSENYAAALQTVLEHHVRIAYIGSIDDQLVSMESSTFSTVEHPYIYRAVFVNAKIHAPDFLTHLVGFALKLRNLGIPDHGLIRELSYPLAGSLYTGDGHSRIYEDPRVYKLAVEYALETTSLSKSRPVVQQAYEVPAAKPNPYYLPWAMRGLLEEEFVRTELKAETDQLLQQFESWKPQSAVLKDVKFRLEAVRSKL